MHQPPFRGGMLVSDAPPPTLPLPPSPHHLSLCVLFLSAFAVPADKTASDADIVIGDFIANGSNGAVHYATYKGRACVVKVRVCTHLDVVTRGRP
jgi:hypothetical protein